MRHQVYFWLANPGDAADREQLIAALRALTSIEEVVALEIGVPASTEERDVVDASFDVCETIEFANVAAQLAYQQHPVHTAFVDQCSHLWKKVVVYDSVAV